MLRNAVGCGRVSDFLEKSVTKTYGSTLLVLRGEWVSNLQEKTLRNTGMASMSESFLVLLRAQR